MPTIEVVADALRDEETPVRVDGVEPGTEVELRASTDAWYEEGCASRATFEASDEGVVDTAEHAPVDGDYDGVEPMGWLWSLAPAGPDGFPVAGRDPVEVALEARVDGETAATATTVRRPSAPGIGHERVADGPVGDLFLPPTEDPRPGVVLLHGSDGHPQRGVAALLAAHGHAAFALQYFGDPDPLPDGLAEVPVEYVDEAAAWLRDRDDVADGPLGVYGQSKGAELALEVAARYDWPGVVVAKAPTTHRWQGLDRSTDRETGSWTADGEVLPFVPFRAAPGDDDGNVVLSDVYANSPERVPDQRIADARIPVERSDADVLLVAGTDDRMWPSTDYAERLAGRLANRDGPRTERLRCEAAGHGIVPPYRPTAGTTVVEGTALGGTPAGNARAAAAFWPRALEFLATLD